MIRWIVQKFKNFYFATGIVFVVWILFFDANDMVSQIRLTTKKADVERERDYYLTKTEEVKFEREELLSTNTLIEKFARERYLMKKPTEDVYIVPDEVLD